MSTSDPNDKGQENWLDRIKSALGLSEPASLREDIEDALQETEASSDFSPTERALLANILHMRDVRVSEVMTPRSRIIGISETASLGELLEAFRTSAHARMPVYGETLDDPKGMVHIRDFLSHLAGAPEAPFAGAAGLLATTVRDAPLLRPVLFVPPSASAPDLMVRMQTKRVHMALVIDEYGETDGLVSMEDLVELIVGDIDDEHDTPDPPRAARLDDVTVAADGEATLAEVSAVLEIDLSGADEAANVDSIGGFVAALAGHVPQAGDEIDGPHGLRFTIVEATPRQIKQLVIRLPAAGEAAVSAPAPAP